MTRALSICILLFCFAACSAEKVELPRQEATPVIIQSDGTIKDFYKRYTGTVAGENVTVHLLMVNNQLSGSYYYDEIGIPIGLWSGEYDAKSKSYSMTESNDEDGPEKRWLVGFEDVRLLGTWMRGEKQRKIVLMESGGTDLLIWRREDSIAAPSTPEGKASTTFLIQALTPGNSMPNDQANLYMLAQLRLLGLDTSRSIESGYERKRDNSFNDYRELLRGASPEELKTDAWSWQHYSAEVVEPAYDYDGILVLGAMNHHYTGGAHGMSGASYMIYDFKRGAEWELEDIMEIDTPELVKILDEKVRERFKIARGNPLGESLLTDSMYVSDNFYITHTGITFNYLPYEIAAYAEGTIELFIQWSEIRGLLKPEFVERMRIP